MFTRKLSGLFRISRLSLLTLLVFVFSGGWPASSLAGDAASLLRDPAHPRRYWVVWKHLIRGTNETYDMGVIDPLSKEPQHEPRLPY